MKGVFNMYQMYTVLGRTTSNFRINFIDNGTPVANFSLAVNRPNGKADFIPCVVWNERAKKLTNEIGKGSLLLVTGELRTYKRKGENGESSYLQLEVDTCKVIDRKEVTPSNSKESNEGSKG